MRGPHDIREGDLYVDISERPGEVLRASQDPRCVTTSCYRVLPTGGPDGLTSLHSGSVVRFAASDLLSVVCPDHNDVLFLVIKGGVHLYLTDPILELIHTVLLNPCHRDRDFPGSQLAHLRHRVSAP